MRNWNILLNSKRRRKKLKSRTSRFLFRQECQVILPKGGITIRGFQNLMLHLLGLEDRSRLEVIDLLKQAVLINPDFAEAHCNLGVAYYHLGRQTEAIDEYKQAIRINPDYADAHFGLGLTYFELGDKGSALEEYKILKELDRNLANNLFNLIDK